MKCIEMRGRYQCGEPQAAQSLPYDKHQHLSTLLNHNHPDTVFYSSTYPRFNIRSPRNLPDLILHMILKNNVHVPVDMLAYTYNIPAEDETLTSSSQATP